MPLSWFPEGTQASSTDDEMRSEAKLVQILYDANGERPSPFPEGVAPAPGDDLERLLSKKLALGQ